MAESTGIQSEKKKLLKVRVAQPAKILIIPKALISPIRTVF